MCSWYGESATNASDGGKRSCNAVLRGDRRQRAGTLLLAATSPDSCVGGVIVSKESPADYTHHA